MANQPNGFKTYSDTRALEGLLLGKSRSEFEKRLYDRGADERDKRYYKYPLEILNHPEYLNAMCIEVWDNNPQYLATKRQVLTRSARALQSA